ncbi:hypothetical protein NML71_05435 [Streptococcus sp. CF4-2]|uniref:hypothetical protein n=1 Tax=unclassified Streptococcus TaxID=2608887 RepID=UPI0020C9D536|nr:MULTISPECIES: hypothetical protein [unclassified Streptococcus]MCP9075892.1 hypothetical protein [Streptococcus sp. CF4-3]MCP9088615.1 hypothetical protein [Streptococcus sp. CF4-2]
MSDQNPNVELNKEEDKLIVDDNSVKNTENGPKAVKKPSALLSFSFYLALTYILLFITLALFTAPWGIVFLIFLGPNLIAYVIATFLTKIGIKKVNRNFLYASAGFYFLSGLLAFDPDWQMFRVFPYLSLVLVIIGIFLTKDINN